MISPTACGCSFFTPQPLQNPVEPLWKSRGTLVLWNLASGPPRTTPEPIWAETPKLSAVGEKGFQIASLLAVRCIVFLMFLDTCLPVCHIFVETLKGRPKAQHAAGQALQAPTLFLDLKVRDSPLGVVFILGYRFRIASGIAPGCAPESKSKKDAKLPDLLPARQFKTQQSF